VTRRRTDWSKLAEAAAGPLIVGGLTFVALDLARRVFRHTQLFCPSRQPVISWNPADYGLPADRVEEKLFETEDGELLYGWYCRAEKPIASGLFFHGNTGNMTLNAPVMRHLLDSGINVLLFDYRGFGRSTGHPTLSGVIADGITAARFHDTIRPPEIPSILYGYSLGGAIAAQVVGHHAFDGLILQSTFTNLPELTRANFRLPLHLVAGNLFDTRTVLESIDIPVMIIHGEMDEVCPVWMANALYDACSGPRRIAIVEGGLHKDLFVRDPDTLVWAVNRFATELPHHTHPIVETPRPLERAIDTTLRYVRRTWRRKFAS